MRSQTICTLDLSLRFRHYSRIHDAPQSHLNLRAVMILWITVADLDKLTYHNLLILRFKVLWNREMLSGHQVHYF